MSAAKMAFDNAEVFNIWPSPDMAVLNAGRRPPVPMPSGIFGPAWNLIGDVAEGVSTSVDYPGMGFLAVCASLIGGKRRVRPYQTSSWAEPCILWCGVVGDPSSRKSPALDAITDRLRDIERDHTDHHKANIRSYHEVAERAKASRAEWQDAMKKAVKAGNASPSMPDDAVEPDEPARRRLIVMDATPEAMGAILAGNPEGTLHFRDELAGWLMSFDRYSPGGREFWLEAYGGRAFAFDRKNLSKGPLQISFNGVSVLGGIQPAKMAAALLQSPDDGLVARFLWAWPDKLPTIQRPRQCADIDALENVFRRLESLTWGQDQEGRDKHITLPLSDDAADVFEQWERDNSQVDEDAAALYKSFVGKMNGVVLRLALVSELVRWAWQGGAEPREVSADSLIAAAEFVDDYAKPMAERVYGDAALPAVERNAAVLARYIRKTGMTSINKRDLKQTPHKAKLPGLRDQRVMDDAVEYLVTAGWLLPRPSRDSDTSGRQRADYAVNPAVHGAL